MESTHGRFPSCTFAGILKHGFEDRTELMDVAASLRRISLVSLFTLTLTAINNVAMFLHVFPHYSLSVLGEGGLKELRRRSQPPSAPPPLAFNVCVQRQFREWCRTMPAN